MIARIKGEIIEIGANFAVVEASGVGYKIFATPELLSALKKKKEEVTFFTHLAIREDAEELYGFAAKEELDFFELLIKVPGIGPKSALSILAVAPIKTLRQAISSGDTSYLTKISGIGKKTAEKVVLELKDRLAALTDEETGALAGDIEVMEALRALGYPLPEIRETVKKIPPEAKGLQDRIREALKILGGKNQN